MMSDLAFAVLLLAFAAAFIQSFFGYSRSVQRSIFWGCAAVGTVAGFLAVYPPVTRGVGASAFIFGVMVVIAYAYTPYIKINGKIRALSMQTPDPNDDPTDETAGQQISAPAAYSGLLTAPKMWWLLVPLMLISSVNTFAFATGEGESWVAVIGIAFLVFLAFATGYGDASWGYPVARGQRLQLTLLTFITLGAFTILYLASYAAAKRRPSRSKHSLEYRAHPHLRERYPDDDNEL